MAEFAERKALDPRQQCAIWHSAVGQSVPGEGFAPETHLSRLTPFGMLRDVTERFHRRDKTADAISSGNPRSFGDATRCSQDRRVAPIKALSSFSNQVGIEVRTVR